MDIVWTIMVTRQSDDMVDLTRVIIKSDRNEIPTIKPKFKERKLS
jgi:hypothetical protein